MGDLRRAVALLWGALRQDAPGTAAVAVALALAPATLAQQAKTPANKADCEKAKMKWDDHSHKCCSDMTASGHCM